jgi:glutathione peroxidase
MNRFAFPALVTAAVAAIALALPHTPTLAADPAPHSPLDFTMTDIDGKPVPLSRYKGKVVLIVNTASKCGFTPQYKSLQALYLKYKDQGLAILAFPANEFGQQEPGSNPEIKQFCTLRYHVSFDMFSKVVVKGPSQTPLYAYLTGKDTNPKFPGEIGWNFTKFLVDRGGNLVARFDSPVDPMSPPLTGAVEKALAEKSPKTK